MINTHLDKKVRKKTVSDRVLQLDYIKSSFSMLGLEQNMELKVEFRVKPLLMVLFFVLFYFCFLN